MVKSSENVPTVRGASGKGLDILQSLVTMAPVTCLLTDLCICSFTKNCAGTQFLFKW